ncbi:MAG: hypothetical protein L0312_29535, partial [Acidobacteria bacterium]|nr:hypothetical protein [Acidobacteriota bacterium]
MATRDLNSRFARGETLINHIREDQLERLRRVGDLWPSHLEDWQDLAKTEESVRREYRGRYLFELLQNANDAIVDAKTNKEGKTHPNGQNIVRLELTRTSLLVANCGLPFAENNIRALCRLHNTTKSASKQIGHKGIGFKSVLEITETPEVYSDCYAFGFDRQEFASKVRQIIRTDTVDDTSLPVLRAPFIRRLSRLPPEDRSRIEMLLAEDDFATVIRLPLKSQDLFEEVERRMRTELRPELLLFLNAIDQLQVNYLSGEDVAFWRKSHYEGFGSNMPGYSDVLLWSDAGGSSHIETRWLLLFPKELPVNNRGLVKDLGDAWAEVQAVACTIAFPLTPDGRQLRVDLPSQPFHVYFPTEEFCGLRFLVNADFYIEAARKDIRCNPLNNWLAEELALHVASAGVAALRARFPRDPAIVDVLAPVQQPEREFGAFFHKQYLLALSASEFVPVSGGQYKTPSEIRFPPKGANPKQFREFFPLTRTHSQANGVFPILEVEERELQRTGTGRPFLLRPELGASRIEVDMVAKVLRDGPPIPSVHGGEFLRFLAHWWNDLSGSERSRLAQALSECAIVPTHSGWQCPSRSLIFQANLREEKDIEVPEGFEFELVPLDVYGNERSYQGVPAQFLETLGVSSYQAREILRRAILPRLTSPELFRALIEHHPNAIYGAYAFLKDYYERERSTVEIQSDLLRIPVPAYRPKHPRDHMWQPASTVYFSSYWTDSDDLEAIYSQFEDVYFLGPIDEL